MHFCAQTWLVGLDRDLPTDPAVAYAGTPPVVGCNHIVCSECRCVVRYADARSITQHYPPGNIDELYDSADPESSPLLENYPRHAQSRAYFCRCEWAAVNFGGESLAGGSDRPWRCGGHPSAT